eukprot:scaffold12122_cov20-Tisochrysis_lutea.AAC.1
MLGAIHCVWHSCWASIGIMAKKGSGLVWMSGSLALIRWCGAFPVLSVCGSPVGGRTGLRHARLHARSVPAEQILYFVGVEAGSRLEPNMHFWVLPVQNYVCSWSCPESTEAA